MPRGCTEMERRVAEAIASDIGGAWQSWITTARAAIRAMALASPAVLEELNDMGHEASRGGRHMNEPSWWHKGDLPGAWKRLILAASPSDSDA